jgi:hypothetical protein
MCFITKKTHQKAIDDAVDAAEKRLIERLEKVVGILELQDKEIEELKLDYSGLSYSHDLTLEAYDRCTAELTQIKNELIPPPVDTSQQPGRD